MDYIPVKLWIIIT